MEVNNLAKNNEKKLNVDEFLSPVVLVYGC